MIELLAASADGWAIAREQGQLWLVRPPYGRDDRSRLSPLQVERALRDEDFVLEQETPTHAGWGDLTRHLQRTVVLTATPEEKASARDAALRLLARANAAQARTHLAELRARLGEGRVQGVESALVALLGAEAVQKDPSLVAEVHELLDWSRRSGSALHARSQPQRAWPVPDEEAVAQETAAIRARGSLLPPAA